MALKLSSESSFALKFEYSVTQEENDKSANEKTSTISPLYNKIAALFLVVLQQVLI